MEQYTVTSPSGDILAKLRWAKSIPDPFERQRKIVSITTAHQMPLGAPGTADNDADCAPLPTAQEVEDAEMAPTLRLLNAWGTDKQDEVVASLDAVREAKIDAAQCHDSGLTPESWRLVQKVSDDFVLLSQGKTLCAYEKATGKEHSQPGLHQIAMARFGHLQYEDPKDARPVSIGNLWWNSNLWHKRTVTGIVLDPTSDDERTYNSKHPDNFNRWFLLKRQMARPDMTATRADIKIFDDHLAYQSGGCTTTVEYVLDWLAYLLQNPDSKPSTGLVFVSPQEGTGKTLFYFPLKWIFGDDLVEFTGGEAIYDNFDTVFVNKRITYLDEMPRPEKMRGRGDPYPKLKRITTSNWGTLRAMYTPAAKMRMPALVITLNEVDTLADFAKGRRFCFILCPDKPREPAYYKTLFDWVGEFSPGPGIPKLAGYLMNRDVSKFDPNGHAPVTSAKAFIRQTNISTEAEFIRGLIEDRRPPFDKDLGRVEAMLLALDAYPPAITQGMRFTTRSLPKALEEIGCKQLGVDGRLKTKDSTRRAWCFRDFETWDGRKSRTYNPYIQTGVVPEDTGDDDE
jgi:hypothetical protein